MYLSPHVESKDDEFDDLSPGSLGSAGGLNSSSNRQRALEEQKKRLMRKQQIRRGSAGTVQANRAFTGAAKKISVNKAGSSFRNFSTPKAIDPLEGEEEDDDAGLRKTGYADSFRGSSRNASGSYGGVYEALHQPQHRSSSLSANESFTDARVANVKTVNRPIEEFDSERRGEVESKYASSNNSIPIVETKRSEIPQIVNAYDRSPAADIEDEFDSAGGTDEIPRKSSVSSSKARSQKKKDSSSNSSTSSSSKSKSRSGSMASKSSSKSSSRRRNYNSDEIAEEDSGEVSQEADLDQQPVVRRKESSATASRRQHRSSEQRVSSKRLDAARRDDNSASEDEDAGEMIVPRPAKKSTRVKKVSEKTAKSRKNIEGKTMEPGVIPSKPDERSEEEFEDEHKAFEDDYISPQANMSSPKEQPELDLSDMRAFLMKPLPKEYGVVQCYIERNKSGAHKLYPEFQVFLKDGDRFLMSGKKRAKNRTTNYVVTMDPKDYARESPNCLGKLRSNFIGTEFQIFDKGVNPKNADPDSLHVGTTPIREELGAILYNSNVLGSRGPRKMRVAIPAIDDAGKRKSVRPSRKNEELLTRFKDRDLCDVVELINKPPRWNDHVGAYVLNFNGRVTMASVKNFQLITAENEDDVILTFGRCGTNLFSMDVAYPLSIFQAFCIAMSSASSKLACE